MANASGRITIVCVDMAEFNRILSQINANPVASNVSSNSDTLTIVFDLNVSD